MAVDKKDFKTPMMQQYLSIKERYSDCLLFFRLGDFYEMFLEDAKVGSEVLDITLTSRDRGQDGRVPMAGIPYHAVNSYLPRLVKAGYKVAICEQLTAPGKDLVERDVVRIVTPGTLFEESSLDRKTNNYIAAISKKDDLVGVAIADISTGVFFADQFCGENAARLLENELYKYHPAECILPDVLYNDSSFVHLVNSTINTNIFPSFDWDFLSANAESFLKSHFGIASLESFGLEKEDLAIDASVGLLKYLKKTQNDKVMHIRSISNFPKDELVGLDKNTIVNLELFSTLREGSKKGSLLNFLDHTSTSMGGRMLKDWLVHPLNSPKKLKKRYSVVGFFLDNYNLRTEIEEILGGVSDLERLISRLSVGVGNARDLVNLKESLRGVLNLKDSLVKANDETRAITKGISKKLQQVIDLIESTIMEDPAVDLKSGGLIKKGFNSHLDELRDTVSGSKSWIEALEKKERLRTEISSLKVKYNQVYGYYIEVTKSNLDLVPEDYQRKQTLVNSERFITDELKHHEEIILSAKSDICDLEYELYLSLVSKVLGFTDIVQKAAFAVAQLDCLISFALVSQRYKFCKPELNDEGKIEITLGRHPVVEELLDSEVFVPNDTFLRSKNSQLHIVTGPNMSGKSVYIRQVAVLVLLVQMGCYAPAKSVNVSLVDKIFVRSGANDMISSGISTFMMEMIEASYILNNATDASLIVMDEIGRGTSTYDGISIAQAIAEFLVADEGSNPKTLFATHYHELQDLEKKYPDKIKNYQVLVQEDHGEPLFLHKVVEGGADSSYGIAVAKLAGLPKEITSRAADILKFLENRELGNGHFQSEATKENVQNRSERKKVQEGVAVELKALLKKIDISNMTPIEALNKLAEIKEKLDTSLD